MLQRSNDIEIVSRIFGGTFLATFLMFIFGLALVPVCSRILTISGPMSRVFLVMTMLSIGWPYFAKVYEKRRMWVEMP